ncbi:24273_t:CDS:2, partial [Cetraspora pellucida]
LSRPDKSRLSYDPVIQFGVPDREIQLTATKRLAENDRPYIENLFFILQFDFPKSLHVGRLVVSLLNCVYRYGVRFAVAHAD